MHIGVSLQNDCALPGKEGYDNKTSSSPYIPIPSLTMFNHLWSLGGVESWGYSGSPKLVSLVVLGLFVEKHKYTEK